ncbi:autophagy protein 5 [Pichia californica]|uniref:Autophagy protein 5 n=1 Tax=Pichia californica TaxID=460514 RepID=A0A9P6WGD0_9ASCO|nr:autophagy protein 5 [[Candida] californica]
MSIIIPKLWDSKICCKINYLNPNNDNNNTLYLTINRNSYLYFKLEEIFEFFKLNISQIPYIWFQDEFSGRILDWNLPIDILFNLFQYNNNYFKISLKISILTTSLLNSISQLQSQSILSYQHHFQSIKNPNFNDVFIFLEKYWRNIIKESCYILNNSSNLIMSMSMQNSINFWNSVKNLNYLEFEKNFNKFKNFNPLNLPLKLYFIKNSNLLFINQPNIHKFFNINSNNKITLFDLLNKLFDNTKNLKCISHGIELPLDSPLIELYFLMKHLDSFLHIIVLS